MEQIALQWEPQRKLLSVSELNATIRGLLDREFGDIWVSGEISGVRLAASGHYYFTLKDEESQLRCVCFRASARYLKFKPQDGVSVLARGRIDVYEARGEYQLLVETLEPQGHGALQFAFELLKKKLAAEGLFEASRKRALPKFPSRIGIVTSPSGAVLQDMLNIFQRRFPGLHIRVYPAAVQGDGSIEAVCRGIRFFSESAWAEVVILARGGGSLEDLWTFNEEDVARAIALCAVPIVSAVGHETDFTIADFVADLRAPTPSAAAELVICTREQLLEQIFGCRKHLEQAIRYRLSVASRRLHQQGIDHAASLLHRMIGRSQQRIDELDRSARDRLTAELRRSRELLNDLETALARRSLHLRLAEARSRLAAAMNRAGQCMELRLARARGRLQPLEAHLTQLSPVKILDRGYAIVQDNQGRVLKKSAEAGLGAVLGIRLAEGRLMAVVKSRE
jgi:exodeoxyribonuclease VII large subunit